MNLLEETHNDMHAEAERFMAVYLHDTEKNMYPVMMECPKCCKQYRRVQAFQEHIKNCKEKTAHSTVLTRSVNMAIEILSTPDIAMYITESMNPPVLVTVIENTIYSLFATEIGYARRPSYGMTPGNNTTNQYRSELKEWFPEGVEYKGKKLMASRNPTGI